MKYFKKIFFLICCVLPLFLAGCKPVVTITAPANGDTFTVGETITFDGQATDPLHPNLADAAFVWTSDKDGEIGTGPSFASSNLSEGEHTITLTVTDPVGQSGQSSVSITVGNDGVPTTTTTIENASTTTTTTATSGQRFTDNGDGTVTDARTGLIWLKNANPCPERKYWLEAVAWCSSLKSGDAGLTDGSVAGQWRLPSKDELEGIGTDPPSTWEVGVPSVTWTKPGAPFTDVKSDFYWSGTSHVTSTGNAWFVYMGDSGNVGSGGKAAPFYVWPVRGGNSTTTTSITTTPTTTTTIAATTTTTAVSGQRFTDNNNGTVTDTRTGLIWLKNANPSGFKSWADAGTYCASLANGQAGLTDGSTAGQWRLPTVQELEGIGTDPPTTYCLDGSCNYPSVTWTKPGTPFTGVQSGYYWSSTVYAGIPSSAWDVSLDVGLVRYHNKSNYRYVWAVRGGN